MSVPQNRPFTRRPIDDDDRELARGARSVPRTRHVDALVGEARAPDLSQFIVSEAADVARTPSEAGTYRRRCCHLTAGAPGKLVQTLLCIAAGELGHKRDVV